MKKFMPLALVIILTLSAFNLPSAGEPASLRQAQGSTSEDKGFVVFQATGPTAGSIQDTVNAYRVALGDPNNGNAPGQLSGRREINWDGGSTTNLNTAVTVGSTLTNFQSTRGALFTTPGTGFVQAPAAADPVQFPPGGLAGLFNNATYGNIFTPFSDSRLFSAIGSNITEVTFFVPIAPGGINEPATVTGFGAVFTDVDKRGKGNAGARIEYFDADGDLLFSRIVPALPGDGSLSFFGIVFDDARIARVRITSGNVAPGTDDGGKRDIVMMDDFLYGEPQPLP
ncbi:MAG TPA: hypothetical protein VFY83_15045 [Anaerolineales bacterium]|nr:hypothetical protein [Anaerolineales bacterium]